MTYTVEQRDALKAAIARGVKDVQVGAERVSYNSLAEIRQALALIEAELAGSNGLPSRITYPAITRGVR